MPIYEYRCDACGHTWEHFAQRVSSPTPGCPSCKAESDKVNKLVSVSSFSLKGDGWYKDGYGLNSGGSGGSSSGGGEG